MFEPVAPFLSGPPHSPGRVAASASLIFRRTRWVYLTDMPGIPLSMWAHYKPLPLASILVAKDYTRSKREPHRQGPSFLAGEFGPFQGPQDD